MAIVVLGNDENLKFPECWQIDLSAAVENMLLEAVHLGLGGVWLGIAPLKERMDKVNQIFQMPANLHPFSIIPFGYAEAAGLTLKLGFIGIILSIIIGLVCSIILYFKVTVVEKIVQAYIEHSNH